MEDDYIPEQQPQQSSQPTVPATATATTAAAATITTAASAIDQPQDQQLQQHQLPEQLQYRPALQLPSPTIVRLPVSTPTLRAGPSGVSIVRVPRVPLAQKPAVVVQYIPQIAQLSLQGAQPTLFATSTTATATAPAAAAPTTAVAATSTTATTTTAAAAILQGPLE